MKTLLSTLILCFSFIAQAGEVITQYEFGTRVENEVIVYNVTLDDEGILEVSEARQPAGSLLLAVEPQLVAVKKISNQNFLQVRRMVTTLANEEVEETLYSIICMMVAPVEASYNHLRVARDYDYNSNTFRAPLELVQGPQGCWVSHKVNLKNINASMRAGKLKSILQVLAYEAL